MDKIDKAETQTMEQMELLDIYRTFHPTDPEYTFFFQLYVEPYPRSIILEVTKQASTIKKNLNHPMIPLRLS